jgi:hypothetical protein
MPTYPHPWDWRCIPAHGVNLQGGGDPRLHDLHATHAQSMSDAKTTSPHAHAHTHRVSRQWLGAGAWRVVDRDRAREHMGGAWKVERKRKCGNGVWIRLRECEERCTTETLTHIPQARLPCPSILDCSLQAWCQGWPPGVPHPQLYPCPCHMTSKDPRWGLGSPQEVNSPLEHQRECSFSKPPLQQWSTHRPPLTRHCIHHRHPWMTSLPLAKVKSRGTRLGSERALCEGKR